MVRFISVVVLLSCSLTSVVGQKAFFVELSGNYPFAHEKYYYPEHQFYPSYYYSSSVIAYAIKESYQTQPGLDILAGQRFSLWGKWMIEPAIGLSWMQFKRSMALEMNTTGNTTDELIAQPGLPIGGFYGDPRFPDNPLLPGTVIQPSDKVGLTDILYLNVPLKLYYPFMNNKMMAGAGISASLVAWSQQVESWMNTQSTPWKMETVNNYSSNGLNNLFFSANINLYYQVFNNIGITTAYHHGLSSVFDVYDNEPVILRQWKSNRINLGLKYTFNQ
jgi:hypothetical protein